MADSRWSGSALRIRSWLTGAIRIRRAPERNLPVLRTRLRIRCLDLRPRQSRPNVRPAAPHGRDDVHAAEDDADDGRPPSGEDDVGHALRLHVHVPQSPGGARPVLDGVERPSDPAAVVHGPAAFPRRGAPGEGRSPGVDSPRPKPPGRRSEGSRAAPPLFWGETSSTARQSGSTNIWIY